MVGRIAVGDQLRRGSDASQVNRDADVADLAVGHLALEVERESLGDLVGSALVEHIGD